MAAVDRIEVEGLNNALINMFREAFKREMWQWFSENGGQELLRVRKWFFSFSVRVKDLRPLFVMLFGPSPSSSGE